MNIDEREDFLNLRDRGLKAQISKSYEEYRRGEARDAVKFLAGLRRASAKSKN